MYADKVFQCGHSCSPCVVSFFDCVADGFEDLVPFFFKCSHSLFIWKNQILSIRGKSFMKLKIFHVQRITPPETWNFKIGGDFHGVILRFYQVLSMWCMGCMGTLHCLVNVM